MKFFLNPYSLYIRKNVNSINISHRHMRSIEIVIRSRISIECIHYPTYNTKHHTKHHIKHYSKYTP